MHYGEARRSRKRRKAGKSRVRADDYFSFGGGLNLLDTPLKIEPGELLGCKNYEPGIRDGYTRVDGYERVDGQTKPSEASFTYMDIVNGTPANNPSIGDTVTGSPSGASGRLLVDVTADPGVVVGRVSGAFADNDTLSGPLGVFGTVNETPLIDLAPTDSQLQAFEKAAADDQRTLITQVPGEGSILGVAPFKGKFYAWRNKTGGASAGMYVSSASGWTEVTLSDHIAFSTGTGTKPSEGDTLTGATSGETATIERIVSTSSTWAGASGFFVLSGASGAFNASEALQVSAATVATSTSTNAAPTLAPDGRYEFRIHNFYGHTNSRRLYGVDGENRAFEYDDSGVYSQIITGMTQDKPTHLAVHQDALWLAFPGGSAQLSGDADPVTWDVVLGAGEIGVGAEITGFLEEVGDSLFIMTEERSYYITGRRGSYVKDEYNFETGSREWTIQRIGQGIYLDQRAFSSLRASDRYGNFSYNAFSDKVQTLVDALRELAIASCISRRKNLYRCFFSDTRFMSIGLRGTKITGITLCDYGVPVRCIESLQEGANKQEVILFGSDDGYVYEADSGKSFDGGEIEAFARIAFHYSRSPTRRKRYRHAAVDISTVGPTTLKASVDYTFASADEPGNPSKDVSVSGGGGFWDISNWDEFLWSTGVVATARFKLEGAGRNVGFLFYHSSDVEGPHSIEGLTLHYSPRRIDRSTNA